MYMKKLNEKRTERNDVRATNITNQTNHTNVSLDESSLLCSLHSSLASILLIIELIRE